MRGKSFSKQQTKYVSGVQHLVWCIRQGPGQWLHRTEQGRKSEQQSTQYGLQQLGGFPRCLVRALGSHTQAIPCGWGRSSQGYRHKTYKTLVTHKERHITTVLLTQCAPARLVTAPTPGVWRNVPESLPVVIVALKSQRDLHAMARHRLGFGGDAAA